MCSIAEIRRKNRFDPRSGFTLIEMMIAMALGAVLLVAVFQATYLSAQFRSRAIESNSSVTGIANTLRDIASDISSQLLDSRTRSATINALNIKEKRAANANGPWSTMAFIDSFGAGQHAEWAWFYGSEDVLILRTPSSSPRFPNMPTDAQTANSSAIIWWVYRGTAPQVYAWQSNGLAIAKKVKLPDRPSGLIRTQIYLDNKGVEHQNSLVIHPSVKELKLSYFDGEKSSTSWNPHEKAGLPRAVQLSMRCDDEVVEQWVDVPVSAGSIARRVRP